jgi:hypothetical protein
MNLASTNLNTYLMQQMGVVIATNPQMVADLLEANDVDLDLETNLSPIELTDAYVDNLPENDSLKLGTAYLISRFEGSSFNGAADENEIKKYYESLENFWDYSNAGGVVGAIAGAVGSGADLGKTIAEGRQKKKFFGQDMAQKQAETRQSIISGLFAKKQAESIERQKKVQEEQKSKRTRNIIIGSVIGATLILGVILFLKMKKNG